MLAFLFGELEEDLLAFRVLEAVAVLLEELVRVALAADADEQRPQVVDAAAQLLGALGEDPLRRALEEQERRPGLERRVGGDQLGVALLERSQVILLVLGQTLEDLASARVVGERRSTGVELEATAFGGHGDAQRVARKHRLGGRPVQRRRLDAGTALLADAEDLDLGFDGLEVPGRRDFLEDGLDVRAQELRRAMTRVADEMKMPGVAERGLVPRTALAEIDLVGDSGGDHPLQRTIDRCPADARVLTAYEIVQFVCSDVPLLGKKQLDDAVALGGALAACRAEAREIQSGLVDRER